MCAKADDIEILGTGVRIDIHPAMRAGEVVFVRLTDFVEFDDGSGTQQRWEGTPQGPYAVEVARSATSFLLDLVENMPNDRLADLGISGYEVSRFQFRAAPCRIDVEPALAARLTALSTDRSDPSHWPGDLPTARQLIRIVGTGKWIDLDPDPESTLAEHARAFGVHITPEERAELAAMRAGEVIFVRISSFIEFDDGSGTQQRWEGTPQGPYAVELARSATSLLLDLVETVAEDLDMYDLNVGGYDVARFEFHAAPRRIEVDPALAARLTLD